MSRFARDAVLATGATFANRLAPCGYELVQVPRNKDQLETQRLTARSIGITAALGFAEPGKSTLPPVFARECKQPIPWRIQQ